MAEPLHLNVAATKVIFLAAGGNPNGFDRMTEELPPAAWPAASGRLQAAGPNWRPELDTFKLEVFRGDPWGHFFEGPIRDGARETAEDHNLRKTNHG